MNIAFYTLGCKVNQYETQAVRELFENKGYSVVTEPEKADVFIINSCTVTAESDRKTRQAVRKFKAKNPKAITVLMGCLPQSSKNFAQTFSFADIVIGNSNHENLPNLVEEFIKSKNRIVEIKEHHKNEEYYTPEISSFSEHTRAFMKIEDGCDRFCTYCIIPYARGFVRSKPINEIKSEAEKLALAGFSEVVLVGINLSSYGKGSNFNLFNAVKAVSEVDGIKRIRLGSLEPDLMSDELLLGLNSIEKFCPQFHLSLQSGCNATLKRMNRHYDSEFYYDLVQRIRKIFNNPAITTDIMVGFAGETEQEFKESMDFVNKVGFAKSHIFAYSRRSGTVADKMPNQLQNSIKQERSHKMIELTNACELEFLKGQIGITASVLFETKQDGFYFGYTENYTPCKVESETDLCGQIKKVKIEGVNNNFCIGKIL
ncbi:MAG: tRNA (N(6)-L-threonylcarbamoyladenosine(37)-C(2))-methylthiotransferase MtaB [Clostridia bacterium]|nr:tRNA (N(6)-L-threonylcarbamoyladenosine(37)-C(2))-methylthiotransferase MtaB [Clostridia bacterium]